jgi:hypothetical protein
MSSDAVVYWQAFVGDAEEHGSNTCRVLTVDLRRLVQALDQAQAEATSLRAEIARLNSIARSTDRT